MRLNTLDGRVPAPPEAWRWDAGLISIDSHVVAEDGVRVSEAHFAELPPSWVREALARVHALRHED